MIHPHVNPFLSSRDFRNLIDINPYLIWEFISRQDQLLVISLNPEQVFYIIRRQYIKINQAQYLIQNDNITLSCLYHLFCKIKPV